MTPQQIFDKVLAHLRIQGRPAIEDGTCLYRGPENTSCAVGCLIPDELYTPDIEEHTVKYTTEGAGLWEILEKLDLTQHTDLLSELQHAHDTHLTASMASFEVKMQEIANNYSLKYTPAEAA